MNGPIQVPDQFLDRADSWRQGYQYGEQLRLQNPDANATSVPLLDEVALYLMPQTERAGYVRRFEAYSNGMLCAQRPEEEDL